MASSSTSWNGQRTSSAGPRARPPSSVVLTSGGSDIVEAFLREANRKRKFQCIVAEGAPALAGHQMARALAERGVETTAVADASVFAMMSRANLVVLSACGVFANGGILAPAGHHTVALAAKSHSVPVVFLAGLHELSPLGPGDGAFDANDLLSPADVIDYTALADCGIGRNCSDGANGANGDVAALSVANPAYDRPARARHLGAHRRRWRGARVREAAARGDLRSRGPDVLMACDPAPRVRARRCSSIVTEHRVVGPRLFPTRRTRGGPMRPRQNCQLSRLPKKHAVQARAGPQSPRSTGKDGRGRHGHG